MIPLGFDYPLTEGQQAVVETVTGKRIDCLIEVALQIDTLQLPALRQVAFVEQANLLPSNLERQAPAGLFTLAKNVVSILAAKFHGRCGRFPTSSPAPDRSSSPSRLMVA